MESWGWPTTTHRRPDPALDRSARLGAGWRGREPDGARRFHRCLPSSAAPLMSSTGVTDADVTTARDCAAARETANWVSAKASAGTVITSEGIRMNEEPKRRVALIGTGGTSSSMGRDRLHVVEYTANGRKNGPAHLGRRHEPRGRCPRGRRPRGAWARRAGRPE